MAIDEKYIALINADIDGDIQPDEKTELEEFLAKSEAGRALREELRSLCSALDAADMLDPPPHLKHVVMNSLPGPKTQTSPVTESPGFWRALLAVPALRYTATFAAGVIMAVAIVDSGQVQQSAFNEVTGLVGTMSDASDIAPVASTVIHKAEVAGTITLRRADPILIIDFDLSTNGPIDIVATYNDKSVWFNGFAQLESTGTSVSAEGGQIRIQVDGKRRYAVYLHNSNSRKLSIKLQFFSNGEPVHQAVLEYEQG
jgi:hypothetical protein